MRMKSVFLCLFIIFYTLTVFCQEEQSFEAGIVSELSGEIDNLGRLADKKQVVDKLLEKGDNESISKLFKADSEIIDEILLSDNEKAILNELNDIKVVYSGVDFLDAAVSYYDARAMIIKGELNQAMYTLEGYVDDTGNRDKRKEAVYWLEYIYFMQGMDDKLISLHKNHYVWAENDAQKFWLGNAYYNKANIAEAETIFQSLKGSAEYKEKADLMLTLIGYSEFGIEYAIEKLLGYIEEKGDKGSYIDFVYLNLGRLYQERNDYEKALYCYDQYSLLTKDEPGNEFWYEMFLLAVKNNSLDNAQRFLGYILDGSKTGDYYTSADYLMAVMLQLQGELDAASEKIMIALKDAEKTSELLITKERLMDRINVLKQQYTDESDAEEKKKIAAKIVKFNNAARTASDKLIDMSMGSSQDEVIRLAILEEEYFGSNSTINEMEDMIHLLNTTSNKKIPKILDKRMENLEEDIVRYKTVRMLANLNNFSTDQYKLAYALSNEIHYMEKSLDIWKNIEKLGLKKGKTKLIESAKKNQDLLKDLKEGLESIAVSSFGDVDSTSLIQQIITEDIRSYEILKVNYRLTRKLVVKNFNKVMARKLVKKKDVLVEENQKTYDDFTVMIDGFQERLKEIDQRYNFTQLDILYAKAKELDGAFEVLQEEYMKESSASSNIENPETQSGE